MECLKTIYMDYLIGSVCQEYGYDLNGSSDSGLQSSYWPKGMRFHLKA